VPADVGADDGRRQRRRNLLTRVGALTYHKRRFI